MMPRTTALPSPRAAVLAIVGVLASFGVVYAICVRLGTNTSPAILAAALAVGLARRPEHLEWRRALLALVLFPVVALSAGAVGATFRVLPVLGAALFCGGISLSVYLRNFGERGRALGRTIALPFLAMLIVPIRADLSRGPIFAIMLVIGAGIVALICSFAVQRIGA